MISDPLFQFLPSFMLFLFKLFLLYRKLAYLSRLIPKKEALASFFYSLI